MNNSKLNCSARLGRALGQLCPFALTILIMLFTFSCDRGRRDVAPTVGETESVHQAMTASSRYIVKFAPGRSAAGRSAVASLGTVLLDIHGIDGIAANLPESAVAALSSNPAVALIEKDPVRVPTAESIPYGVSMVQADQVSDSATANRTVCIIDSGYAGGHEDLISASGVTGVDGTAGPWSTDGCGHGTHVAGIVSAVGGNNRGVVGVNPGGTIGLHAVRVFADQCYWAYASNLIDAAYRCRDAGANVINMSLGCSGSTYCASTAEEAAFADLYDNYNILPVAAAGNDGANWNSYPSSYPSVVSVAAIDQNEDRAYFSNYNNQVELAAPGVSVLSTVPPGCYLCRTTGSYEAWSGTSMATPYVAGVAALVWSHDPTWTARQIRTALQLTAKDLATNGRDDFTGHGLVRARAALDLLLGNPPPACSSNSDCSDSDPCTTDVCQGSNCSHTAAPDDTVCGGGSGVCCSGACEPGLTTCTPECTGDAECDDADPCTADACNSFICAHTVLADDTACGGNGVCCSGACLAQTSACPECSTNTDCNDGNACTTDSCSGGVCTHGQSADETSCGNGVCCGGACWSGYAACPTECADYSDCDDGNACTGNACSNGVCAYIDFADGTPCGGGVCCAGSCRTGTSDCSAGCSADAECDDGDACTADSCSGGACMHDVLADDAACDGGTGVCCDGICQAGLSACPECTTNAHCNDGDDCTADACSAGTCVFVTRADNTTCGGGAGVCCGGACQSGLSSCPECAADSDCDDGDACTTDSCGSGTCVNTVVADGAACDSGVCCDGVCANGASSCDATSVCGDGYCAGNGLEDGLTCSADCPCSGKNCTKSNCGDGRCDAPESVRKCPVDCL